MAKISLYTVTEREKLGLWNGTEKSHETVSAQSHDSRGVRFQQIIDYVEQNPSCTRGQIAKAMGMSKSPHFARLVEELVKLGLLEKVQSTMPNGMRVFYYTINVV